MQKTQESVSGSRDIAESPQRSVIKLTLTGFLRYTPLWQSKLAGTGIKNNMDYELYDDRALVDGILNNDGKLIEYFFNKKCSGLFAYIIVNIFDGNVDKQDLSQELFMYLATNDWYKVRQFDFRSKLMTWVTVVAVRFFQKKRKELIEKSGSMPLNDKMWQEQSRAISIERRMDLYNALAKMPNARYRKVIEVLDLQEVRPEILAKEMKVTVDNLYNIHHRALLQLRLVMGRKEEYYD